MYVDTNAALYELKRHGTAQFPFQIYVDQFKDHDSINSHWHQELELLYLPKGSCLLHINGRKYQLEQGEGLYINSNALHEMKLRTAQEQTESVSLLFSPVFIAPISSSIFQKMVYPVISDQQLSACKFSEEVDWQNDILHCIRQLFDWNKGTRQNQMRPHLLVCQLWEIFSQHIKDIKISADQISTKTDMADRERARQMLNYIYKNYSENISVDRIAAAAGISRSECFRCFQRMVGKKPFEFLSEYRLETAAKLLQDTKLSICDISLQCGFNNQSYFGKKFREYYKMTPLEFRKCEYET